MKNNKASTFYFHYKFQFDFPNGMSWVKPQQGATNNPNIARPLYLNDLNE